MKPTVARPKEIGRHCGEQSLEAVLVGALSALGKDVRRPRIEDLWTVDQLHNGGRWATCKLAAAAG